MKSISYDQNELNNENDKRKLITIRIEKQKYYISPVVALYLIRKQSIGYVSPSAYQAKPGQLPIPDCMYLRPGKALSLFTLCDNSEDSAAILRVLMNDKLYFVSQTTLEYIDQNPDLRIDETLRFCAPLFNKVSTYDPVSDLVVAEQFLFLPKEEAPSASVVRIMSRSNLIALSLWALFSATEDKPILANQEHLLTQDQLISEMLENPMLIAKLPPVFRVLVLLLEHDQLNVSLSTKAFGTLYSALYRKECFIPEEMHAAIVKRLAPMYSRQIVKHAKRSPNDRFVKDFYEFQPMLDQEEIIKIVISCLIDNVKLPKDILRQLDIGLLQRALHNRFEKLKALLKERDYSEARCVAEENGFLLNSLLLYVKEGELASELFNDLDCLNNVENLQNLFKDCDLGKLKPLCDHLTTLSEFLPFLIQSISEHTIARVRGPIQLSEDQFRQLVGLLESEQYKENAQKIKWSLVLFNRFLFKDDEVHRNELIKQIGAMGTDSIDQLFAKMEKGGSSELHRIVRLLLEANKDAANQYYLSGLRQEQYAYRVEWLHRFGFKIDLSQIELLLRHERVTDEDIVQARKVLSCVRRALKGLKGSDSIEPLDSSLKKTLISLFKKEQSQFSQFLPQIQELQPFEDCVISLFKSIGIAEDRLKNKAHEHVHDRDILKLELIKLFRDTPHDKMRLLINGDKNVCESLLKVYTWSITDAQYRTSVMNQMYDLLVDGLNQSPAERTAARNTLRMSRQIDYLESQFREQNARLAEMSQLLMQQNQLIQQQQQQQQILMQRLSLAPQQDSNPRTGFFNESRRFSP